MCFVVASVASVTLTNRCNADGNGTITIRVTPAELEELVHYNEQASFTTLGRVRLQFSMPIFIKS